MAEVTGAAAPGRVFHVAGLVVHGRPGELDAIVAAIAAMPGVEVHGVDPRGRIAIAIGADSAAGIAGIHIAIGELGGVMAASLVYEHHEEIEE